MNKTTSQTLDATSPRLPDEAPRRRALLFRMAAIFVGLAPFLAFETLCIALDWGRPSLHDDPFVGFQATRPLFVLNDARTLYEIPKSRQGYFRPAFFPAAKPADEFRIFCLGGSTVQGEPFENETAFPTWLELALQAVDPSRRWKVVNCGGTSYSTFRLAPILEEVLQYQPDLIVFYEGHNEFLEKRTFDHLKQRGPVVSAALEQAMRLRSFVLLREGVLRLGGQSSAEPSIRRPVLPTEVEALLDFRGGLEEYHRDDVEQAAVVEQFRFNLRRMTAMARQAGAPILLMNPVCNLGDCPPFKSEHRSDLSPSELAEWESLCDQAAGRLRGSPGDVAAAARLYEEACKLDPLHSGGFYNLAKCYEKLRDFPRARQAYLQAKELDVCPLRVLQKMNEAVLQIARETGAPLVDAKALIETRSSHGIVGGDWLVDHVHPNFDGHKLLADAVVEQMTAVGWVRPQTGWQERKEKAWREHFASLGDYYFLRGESRLERLRGWAHGRAKRLRRPAFGVASPATIKAHTDGDSEK